MVNGRRWLLYNAAAALALAVNTAVFALTYRLVGSLAAALAGVAAGTVVTYRVCDRLIFATRAPEGPEATEEPEPLHRSAP